MDAFSPWRWLPEQQQQVIGDPEAPGPDTRGDDKPDGGRPNPHDSTEVAPEPSTKGRDYEADQRPDPSFDPFGGVSREAPETLDPDLDVAPLGIEDTKLHDDNMKNVADFIESELAKGTKQAERNAAIASKIAGMSIPGIGNLLGELIGKSIRDKQEAFEKGVRGLAETDVMAAAVDASLGPDPTGGGERGESEGPPDENVEEEECPEGEDCDPDDDVDLPPGLDPDDDIGELDVLTDPFEGNAMRWAQRIREDIKRESARLAQI